VAVNLSGRHFAEGDVVESVTAALSKTGLDHRLLEVEVTERVLLQNPERVAGSLQTLRDLGVSAVVDDFGTGYASMSSLHQFPIDAIKIDRRFVHGLGTEEEASTVVRAVVFLGRKLHLGVVAEGVEDEQQLELLKAEGCSAVQGNYFSPPLASQEFLSWIVERPPADATA
jgi:EAL domain-containing protein (putative c-di-GMP-specific phosphodiesterase class I)